MDLFSAIHRNCDTCRCDWFQQSLAATVIFIKQVEVREACLLVRGKAENMCSNWGSTSKDSNWNLSSSPSAHCLPCSRIIRITAPSKTGSELRLSDQIGGACLCGGQQLRVSHQQNTISLHGQLQLWGFSLRRELPQGFFQTTKQICKSPANTF